MIKAIIFDFDGVILESATIKTDAFHQMVLEYPAEIGKQFLAYHMSHMGVSRYDKFRYLLEDLLNETCTDEKLTMMGQKFTAIVYRKIMEAPFVPGAKEFLEQSYQPMDLYIASGTPESEMRQIVDQRGLKKYFVEVHGSPATKEEIASRIMNMHGYGKEETVFVGDAKTDLDAATACGIVFVGRKTTENQADFQGLKYSIDDLRQLGEICNRYSESL